MSLWEEYATTFSFSRQALKPNCLPWLERRRSIAKFIMFFYKRILQRGIEEAFQRQDHAQVEASHAWIMAVYSGCAWPYSYDRNNQRVPSSGLISLLLLWIKVWNTWRRRRRILTCKPLSALDEDGRAQFSFSFWATNSSPVPLQAPYYGCPHDLSWREAKQQ